ncbi:MAG TPA: hypothetical protein PKK10_06435 [Woeseiaceae bacterium]|nr:hypothetical protein [Woeseiaceae bacterium]
MHKHSQIAFQNSQVIGHLIATIGLVITAAGVQAETAANLESSKEIPTDARISSVTIVRDNIFNLANSKEDNALYRLINRLHIVTRQDTIEKQLLFAQGDQYTQRLIDESERILRGNKYLYDASITPTVNKAGNVDVRVWSRDIWTLTPEITLSRSGGENKTAFGIEESNLLGRGQRLEATWAKDVERSSVTFEFSDRQFMNSWVALDLLIADNSDGHSRRLSVVKPFHALDARHAGGLTAYDDDRRSTFYDLGDEAAEYRHQRKSLVAFGGFSHGLKNGWVRRWTYGAVYDDNHFLPVQEPTLPQVIPPDRKLVYPFAGFEILEDRFEKSANSNQIDRVEDFFLGTRLALTLGWSDTGFGADRDALIYTLTANHSYGSMKRSALLLSGGLRGRDEGGTLANATADMSARLYLRQSERLLFFTQVTGVLGHNLDEDQPVEIGGDTGLRGYPLRYQAGESSLIVSVEQRYFTNWYPFRLVRVGAAVFADAGRVWGPNELNSPNLGWLSDIGFGLRFAPTRLGTTKVFHLDIAFPLGGAEDIDSVQVLFSAKRSF